MGIIILFPHLDLARIDTIRGWDNAVVAPLSGFVNAEDYYYRSSALRVMREIRVPSLVVQAQDDPFIPFAAFRHPDLDDNEYLRLLAPRRGGHVGFFSARNGSGGLDRFWAENRALAFCAEQVGLTWPPTGHVDDLLDRQQ